MSLIVRESDAFDLTFYHLSSLGLTSVCVVLSFLKLRDNWLSTSPHGHVINLGAERDKVEGYSFSRKKVNTAPVVVM